MTRSVASRLSHLLSRPKHTNNGRLKTARCTNFPFENHQKSKPSFQFFTFLFVNPKIFTTRLVVDSRISPSFQKSSPFSLRERQRQKEKEREREKRTSHVDAYTSSFRFLWPKNKKKKKKRKKKEKERTRSKGKQLPPMDPRIVGKHALQHTDLDFSITPPSTSTIEHDPRNTWGYHSNRLICNSIAIPIDPICMRVVHVVPRRAPTVDWRSVGLSAAWLVADSPYCVVGRPAGWRGGLLTARWKRLPEQPFSLVARHSPCVAPLLPPHLRPDVAVEIYRSGKTFRFSILSDVGTQ